MYGSSGNHIALSAFEASDGGYYFTEIFTASGSQRSDTLLSKLNSDGIPVWSRLYKSPGSSLNASVSKTGNNLLLAGNITASGGSNSRGIVMSLDENGTVLWRKRVNPDSRPVFVGRPTVSSSDGSICDRLRRDSGVQQHGCNFSKDAGKWTNSRRLFQAYKFSVLQSKHKSDQFRNCFGRNPSSIFHGYSRLSECNSLCR